LNDAELGLYKNIKLKKLKNSKSKSYEWNNEIYFLNSKWLQWKLKYTEKWFKVFKWTTANLIDTNAMPWVKLKKELVNNGILVKKWNLFEFSKDYIFPAPSAASAIILWRNSNWWTEWKTKDWRMLDELRKK
jgi:hypothetical protein